jgi:ABC-type sugar transport system ATPase subunit
VVVSSTDLAEPVGLCDRVLLRHGRLADTATGDRLSEHEPSLAMSAGLATP